MSHESPWFIFALGIVLDLPGLWYLFGLKNISLGGYSTWEEVVLILGFNLIMFTFIEAPLIGYLVAPEWTRLRVDDFNAWLRSHARRIGGYIALGFGVYFLARGLFFAL